MTAALLPLCVLASWQAVTTRIRSFMAMLLVMEAAMLGVFMALDFVLFYVFWEAMLIPMYLLIGVWGGPNRLYAAIKFFLYTLAGSVLLLVAILVLFFYGGHTFDILALSQVSYPTALQMWLFLALFAAFAVKVPMFPFHTWLPDAHVEAPTAGSVLLASVLLKMGTYGFIRFSLPMLPDASQAFTPAMIALSIVAFVVLSAGAYVGGDVVFALGNMVDRHAWRPAGAKWQPLEVGDLPDGTPVNARLGLQGLVVVRSGETIHALHDQCAHAGGPLSGGRLVDGCIECPWHGSRFELATGRRRRGPTVYDQPTYEVRPADAGGYEARRTS
jgi:nitrite reductase/ring-hydroxylating ferredoxin subunit